MDNDMPATVLAGRRKKKVLIIFVSVVILAATIGLFRSSFKSPLCITEVTTAVAKVGKMENTINASGEMLPEFKQVITSPIIASIKNVMMDAGASVKTRQSISSLDKEASENDFQN